MSGESIRIGVTGAGAVSPAGWGVEALHRAAVQGKRLDAKPFGDERLNLRKRAVPKPENKLPFLRDPRLRRGSTTRFCTVPNSSRCRRPKPVVEMLPGVVAMEQEGRDLFYVTAEGRGSIALGQPHRWSALLLSSVTILVFMTFVRIRPTWQVVAMAIAAGPDRAPVQLGPAHRLVGSDHLFQSRPDRTGAAKRGGDRLTPAGLGARRPHAPRAQQPRRLGGRVAHVIPGRRPVMKIGFLLPAVYAVGRPFNGVREQAIYQAEALEQLGHEVVRLDPWEKYDLDSFDVVQFFSGGLGLHLIENRRPTPLRMLAFAAIIDSLEPNWRYRIAAGLGNVFPTRLFTVQGAIQRQALGSDLVIARSTHEKERLVDGLGVDPDRVEIVLNGVCPPRAGRPGRRAAEARPAG